MKVTNAEQLQLNGISLGPDLTKEQAGTIFAFGKEAVIFALLAQAKMIADQYSGKPAPSRSDDPSCPSAQKPPYEKPSKKGRKKKPGRKKGHEGSCRPNPEHVDHTEIHRAKRCPDCGAKLKNCTGSRERYLEDIPKDVKVDANVKSPC